MHSIRAYSRIVFTQRTNGRSKTLTFTFCNSFEATSSWVDLCDKATIVLPRNIYVRDQNNQLIPLGGTNVNIGGFSNNDPLILRGDGVSIESGYRYINNAGAEVLTTSIVFKGFVTAVGSKKPFEIQAEDNMYLLKQTIAPNKTYSGGVEAMLKELIKDTPFTVNVLTETSIGDFSTRNETVAEVLARLQKDFHFESYFRGDELRIGSFVYIESDAIAAGRKIFKFQQNIIEDELEYNRRDDVQLSCIAYSINKIELQQTTKRGKKKTKSQRLEVLVSYRLGKFVRNERPLGGKADYAPNTAGERRTLYFWDVTDVKKLGDLAEQELVKYLYTGFKGSFLTFGVPYVKQGDNVDIIDTVMPERNGRYKVKSVEYTGGIDAPRQKINLDYMITRLDNNGNAI